MPQIVMVLATTCTWLLFFNHIILRSVGLQLTADLQCSACAIAADVIHEELLHFIETTDVSSSLQDHIISGCRSIPKAAIVGKTGKREFIDFSKAMRKEDRGSKQMGLVNVRFGADVTSSLQQYCTTITQVCDLNECIYAD